MLRHKPVSPSSPAGAPRPRRAFQGISGWLRPSSGWRIWTINRHRALFGPVGQYSRSRGLIRGIPHGMGCRFATRTPLSHDAGELLRHLPTSERGARRAHRRLHGLARRFVSAARPLRSRRAPAHGCDPLKVLQKARAKTTCHRGSAWRRCWPPRATTSMCSPRWMDPDTPPKPAAGRWPGPGHNRPDDGPDAVEGVDAGPRPSSATAGSIPRSQIRVWCAGNAPPHDSG